jgi:transcriptional regulator with PAS, ATPase and Fis domain
MENVIEYALHLTDEGKSITLEQLPPIFSGKKDISSGPQNIVSIEEYTKQSIQILQNNYTEEEIAAILEISRKSLWEKRKRWDLPRA